MIKKKNIVRVHSFTFCYAKIGGESLQLITEFINNEDGDIYKNQKLILQGNFNSAIFDLVGISITPENLRKLADELEKEQNKALNQFVKD